jgi:hypothetical protein
VIFEKSKKWSLPNKDICPPTFLAERGEKGYLLEPIARRQTTEDKWNRQHGGIQYIGKQSIIDYGRRHESMSLSIG